MPEKAVKALRWRSALLDAWLDLLEKIDGPRRPLAAALRTVPNAFQNHSVSRLLAFAAPIQGPLANWVKTIF
jgi:hypothetical protein